MEAAFVLTLGRRDAIEYAREQAPSNGEIRRLSRRYLFFVPVSSCLVASKGQHKPKQQKAVLGAFDRRYFPEQEWALARQKHWTTNFRGCFFLEARWFLKDHSTGCLIVRITATIQTLF